MMNKSIVGIIMVSLLCATVACGHKGPPKPPADKNPVPATNAKPSAPDAKTPVKE